MTVSVGVDLGGTNIRVAVYEAAAGGGIPTELAEDRSRLGDDLTPESVALRVAGTVARLLPPWQHPTAPVGVGLAGMLRGTTGVVSNAPNLGWRDVPFGELLSKHLRGRRVFLYNDVNAIAYGEFRFGAGKGATDLLCVFAGTGIGGGYVAAGRMVPGATGAAGEIGHTKVKWGPDAAPCFCGQRGCVEAYAGGRVLGERIRREARERRAGLERLLELAGGHIDALHPGHLDQAVAEGHPYPVAIYDEVAPLLGVVLANAVTLLNPDRLVMGGGMWSRAPAFQKRVLATFHECVGVAAAEVVEVLPAALEDDAGILGTAALALTEPALSA